MKTTIAKSTAKRNKPGPEAKASSALSRPAKPQRSNKPSTSQPVRRPWGEPLAQHDVDLIERLVALPNDRIHLSDSPEIKKNLFRNQSGILSSGLFKPYKQQVTLRIDGDILAWARQAGAGYQSRLNAALRAAMLQDLHAKQGNK